MPKCGGKQGLKESLLVGRRTETEGKAPMLLSGVKVGVLKLANLGVGSIVVGVITVAGIAREPKRRQRGSFEPDASLRRYCSLRN
jgi:hypothetical protein